MTTWNGWYDDVMPEVGGATTALVDYAIKRAVIDFCSRTQLLQRTSPAFDFTTQGEQSFPTSAIGTSEKIINLLDVWWLEEELEPITIDQAEAMYGKDWRTFVGTPLYYTQERDDKFFVVPSPTSQTITGALKVKVSYAPNESATSVDDLVLNQWREAVGSGAKARLMAMAGKPWSNPQMAGVYSEILEFAVNTATLRRIRGTPKAQLKTTPHHF